MEESKEKIEIEKSEEKREKQPKRGFLGPAREQVENVGDVSGSLFKVFFVELFGSLKFIALFLYDKYKGRKAKKNNNSL